MNKLLVVTACFWEDTSPIIRLEESCKKFDIPLRVFGVGGGFKDYTQMKTEGLLEFLPTIIADYEYIMYTDGFDSWLLKDEKEIIKRFEKFDSDIVIASNYDCYPNRDLAKMFPSSDSGSDYVCAGQIMGKAEELLKCIKVIARKFSHIRSDQGAWALAFVEGLADISIDYDDKIFNTATRHKSGLPDSCSIHFAGGSSNLENMNKAYKLWKELP